MLIAWGLIFIHTLNNLLPWGRIASLTRRWHISLFFIARRWLGPTIEGVWGERHAKTRSFLANIIILSAISYQFSTSWGRIVDPHLRVIRPSRASRLLVIMYILLWIVKNRNRLHTFHRFNLSFPLFSRSFSLHGADEGRNSEQLTEFRKKTLGHWWVRCFSQIHHIWYW